MVGTVISHAGDLSYLVFSSWGVTQRGGSLHLRGRAKGEALKKNNKWEKKTVSELFPQQCVCVLSRNPPFMPLISYSAADMTLQASGWSSVYTFIYPRLSDLQLDKKKQHANQLSYVKCKWKTWWRTTGGAKGSKRRKLSGCFNTSPCWFFTLFKLWKWCPLTQHGTVRPGGPASVCKRETVCFTPRVVPRWSLLQERSVVGGLSVFSLLPININSTCLNKTTGSAHKDVTSVRLRVHNCLSACLCGNVFKKVKI